MTKYLEYVAVTAIAIIGLVCLFAETYRSVL